MGFFDEFSGGDDYGSSGGDVGYSPDISYSSDPMGNFATDNDFTIGAGQPVGSQDLSGAFDMGGLEGGTEGSGGPTGYTSGTGGSFSFGGATTDSIINRLKNINLQDALRMGGSVYKIWRGVQSGQDMSRAVNDLRAAQAAGNPLAQARITAAGQANQMMQDPMSYMSSPIAQMQIDQMNRAVRAKQASLGQTWNIGADGGIQGSGVGAVDFARELQTNLARQYETALMNRANIGGMNLFPNPGMYAQTPGAIAGRDQVRSNTVGAVGDLATTVGRTLFPNFKLGDIFGG